jgi:hypothetical protein
MSWFEVLERAREICPDGERRFTAADLADHAALAAGGAAKPEQIASAWLSKFVKWGYATRAGRRPGPFRPLTLYVLTRLGLTCVRREALQSRLDRLVAAVRRFVGSRGNGKEEGAAFAALVRTCAEVAPPEEDPT